MNTKSPYTRRNSGGIDTLETPVPTSGRDWLSGFYLDEGETVPAGLQRIFNCLRLRFGPAARHGGFPPPASTAEELPVWTYRPLCIVSSSLPVR